MEHERPKANWHAVIIAALIGGFATIAGSYLNYIKPSEAQVVGSEAYRILAESNEAFRRENKELVQQAATLEAENKTLQVSAQASLTSARQDNGGTAQADDVARLLERIAALESENARLRSAAGPPIGSLRADASSPSTKQGRQNVPVTSQSRIELTLLPGVATRVTPDLVLTASSLYENSDLKLRVNGEMHSSLYPGHRVPLPNDGGRSCFLEVMSLNPNFEKPSARVDHVCLE